jgi:hypothetical protein
MKAPASVNQNIQCSLLIDSRVMRGALFAALNTDQDPASAARRLPLNEPKSGRAASGPHRGGQNKVGGPKVATMLLASLRRAP